jgi:hypothetical protein
LIKKEEEEIDRVKILFLFTMFHLYSHLQRSCPNKCIPNEEVITYPCDEEEEDHSPMCSPTFKVIEKVVKEMEGIGKSYDHDVTKPYTVIVDRILQDIEKNKKSCPS